MRRPALAFAAVLALAVAAAPHGLAHDHEAEDGATRQSFLIQRETGPASSPAAIEVLVETFASDDSDPVINVALMESERRVLLLQAANHAPYDLMAQAPGGALAQAMGLGEEPKSLTLFNVTGPEDVEAMFCGPGGPSAIVSAHLDDTRIALIAIAGEAYVVEDGEDQPVISAPPESAICARATYRIAP